MKSWFYSHSRWLIPLLLLLLITPITPYLDLHFASKFYDPTTGQFSHHPFFEFIYHYGQLPGFIAAGVSLFLLVMANFDKRLKRYKSQFLLMVLAMLIGPGLMINVILKPMWGRPRPRQITVFGGDSSFRPFYSPNLGYMRGDVFKSMPSGHASMGFYLYALGIVGMRIRNKKIALFGFLIATVNGVLLGITRIAQGGHFFSDVLMAAIITWTLAISLDWLIHTELSPYENRTKYA